MFIKSVRFKIMLWYMLILAVTLFAFNIVLYHNFSRKLYKNIDEVLYSSFDGSDTSGNISWEARRLEIENAEMKKIDSTLRKLRIIMVILLPFTVLLTSVVGGFLAKIALNPVDKMIHTIHQITTENLKLRIDIPDTKDEIKRLADTFNQMLMRLEYGFTTQRQFIEDFAHELKTPLAVLKGELEVTLKKIRSTEEYESVIHSNLEEVNRISKIVEDLLTIVRFEINVSMLELKQINISALVQDITEDIKILALQKNININCLAKDPIFIWGDENQLKRLFINILDNAIKYTPHNGNISVEISRADNYANIAISDTGIGIPENEIVHIFDRFYRLKKFNQQPGFGLGLSIAKSVIEAHKGKIDVKSTLNKGTTFIISLPLPPSV
ncbi:MAG: ATP-binding protein [bacterium]|nr:ATP-binding protein [bacterium]